MLRTILTILGVSIATSASAVPVLWSSADGGNDHYYEYFDANVSWDAAHAAAAASTFGGDTGYLVTVTSAAENTFLFGLTSNGNVWLGANDLAAEGTFEWVTGPEAGTVFYTGGAVVAGQFSGFVGSEPNNAGGNEPYVHSFGPGFWNDHSPFATMGYVVEYGGLGSDVAPVPLPASGLLLGAALGFGALRRRR